MAYIPRHTLCCSSVYWSAMAHTGLPRHTFAALVFIGVPWRTYRDTPCAALVFIGVPWRTLGYNDTPCAAVVFIGVPWSTLGPSDVHRSDVECSGPPLHPAEQCDAQQKPVKGKRRLRQSFWLILLTNLLDTIANRRQSCTWDSGLCRRAVPKKFCSLSRGNKGLLGRPHTGKPTQL
jgi:hypothetical protein